MSKPSIRTFTATGRDAKIAAAALASCLAAISGCKGDMPPPDTGPAMCTRDATTNASTAEPLMAGENDGYICPRTDQDWYSVDVPASARLLRINLATSVMRSPIQPIYSIWHRQASGEAGMLVASSGAAAAGQPLVGVHCVDPGAYVLEVHDEHDDGQDIRNPYKLTVTTSPEPDTNEPNNTAMMASTAAPGTAVTGTIACTGDEDWYRVDVPAGTVLAAHLMQPVAKMQPTLRILDAMSMQLLAQTNAGGTAMATDIAICRLVPGGLTYYVVVQDDNDMDSDPDVPYMVTIQTIPDSDTHEDNNAMTTATQLSPTPVACGAAWSTDMVEMGTIACAGDTDWYALPLASCIGGVLEATLSFDTSGLSAQQQWEFQSKVQASIELIHPDSSSPCTTDAACATLTRSCHDTWGCAGALNTCLQSADGTSGLCAGANLCTPASSCAAIETQRTYRAMDVPMTVTGPPPPDTIALSAPILDGAPLVYLRITDYQSDGGDSTVPYTLHVRVRADPDPQDHSATPNNIYTNVLPETMAGVGVDENEPRAVHIPIHHCESGDCCNDSTWITSAISYENDFDWYKYDSPCPGEDCMVRIRYQIDAGPVQPLLNVYHGGSMWFDEQFPAGSSGNFGGVGADRCFYSYHSYTDGYYLLLRDKADDGHDWSSDQTIRFCVEEAATGCQAPCVNYPPPMGYGCDFP